MPKAGVNCAGGMIDIDSFRRLFGFQEQIIVPIYDQHLTLVGQAES